MDEKSINRLKAVPRIEPDYTRCRAVVISAGIDSARQCARQSMCACTETASAIGYADSTTRPRCLSRGPQNF